MNKSYIRLGVFIILLLIFILDNVGIINIVDSSYSNLRMAYRLTMYAISLYIIYKEVRR